MNKLLIADRSEDIRKQLKWAFRNQYSLILAASHTDAVGLFRKHRPKVALLDAGLAPPDEGADAFHCLTEMMSVDAYAKIIMMVASTGAQGAARAIQNGAYDVLKKPIDLGEVNVVCRRAFHLHGLEEENRKLRLACSRKGRVMSGMIGQSPAMVDVLSTIRKVAASDVSVLIQGESGTGKELAARAIHDASSRRSGNFLIVNCGTGPGELIEAGLLAHEVDNTTAPHTTAGRALDAQGGTLFLDEIGELPGVDQARLLRSLQDRSWGAQCGATGGGSDVRILAATSRVIGDDIKSGRFREDLYYRIAVVTVQLPPLRERKDDISLLASLFLMRFAEAFRKRVKGFSSAALEQIEAHAWPGNVRELENRVQRAVVLSEGPLIEPHDLGFGPRPAVSSPAPMPATTLKDARERIERQMIMQAMDRRKGNIAQAAEDLGISRPTLYDIMKKHGLFHMTHHSS